MTAIEQPPDVTELGFTDLCPAWEQLTADEQDNRCAFSRAVGLLFFNGGRLADYGITVKPGIDEHRVVRFLHVTLADYGPTHEHKIGGIAHMLKKWCDIAEKGEA